MMRNFVKTASFRLLPLLGAAVFVFYPVSFSQAQQAALFINPAAGSFLVGSTFDMSIILDTKEASVNAVEVELIFPPDKIQITNPSIGRSIIQLWPAPPVFSNREGRIHFVGGIPSPGIVTSRGVVLTLTFRVIGPGEGEIKFGDKTRVLANDGRGTNIVGQRPSVFYKFLVPPPLGPVISSPTHPDQEKWYKDPNPVLIWSRGPLADGYSYAIDNDPQGFPDTEAEGTVSGASFKNLSSGIWYFHLRERAGGVWGGVSHYVIKIDNQIPAAFKVNVSPAQRTINRNPVFRFFTTDDLSGLDHFEMKVVPLSDAVLGESLFFEVTSPYQAPNFEPGRYQVILRAIDKAGNNRDEAVTMNIVSSFTQFLNPEGIDLIFIFIPWSTIVLIVLMLLLILGAAIFIFWLKHRHHVVKAFHEDMAIMKNAFRGKKPPISIILVLTIAAGPFLWMPVHVYAANTLQSSSQSVILPSRINVAPITYYPLEEVLYLEGSAEPNANIEIFFEPTGTNAQPVRIILESNSGGEWFFSERRELASGEWMIRARSVKGNLISAWSNPRVVRSVVSGFIFGSLKIRYLPIVVTFILIFLVLLGLLVWAALRVRRIRRIEASTNARERERALEKQIRERELETVETIMEERFADIRRDIIEELEHINAKAKDGEQLSKEEEEHRSRLLEKLRQAEESVGKKLKGII